MRWWSCRLLWSPGRCRHRGSPGGSGHVRPREWRRGYGACDAPAAARARRRRPAGGLPGRHPTGAGRPAVGDDEHGVQPRRGHGRRRAVRCRSAASPDRAVFRAVRAIADVVLVAAGTFRTEGYGPVRLSEESRAARVAAGRSPEPPRLAVVSASLDVDVSRPAEGPVRPLVLTTEDADRSRREALEVLAEVRAHGAGRVDLGMRAGRPARRRRRRRRLRGRARAERRPGRGRPRRRVVPHARADDRRRGQPPGGPRRRRAGHRPAAPAGLAARGRRRAPRTLAAAPLTSCGRIDPHGVRPHVVVSRRRVDGSDLAGPVRSTRRPYSPGAVSCSRRISRSKSEMVSKPL